MAEPGQARINRIWYGQSWLRLPLKPISWLYGGITGLRRWLYRAGWMQSHRVAAPVVVIGNLTAGGTGKTPVTLWLVDALRQRGIRAGVVSRGYGAEVGATPLLVVADSAAATVGDEPLLIARRGRCPVVVHPDRVAAAERLLQEGVDVVLADDGLQHYRLQRDFEIALIDGQRGFGNGLLLPAGPLREPGSRLARVDRVIVNGEASGLTLPAANSKISHMQLRASRLVSLNTGESRPLSELSGTQVHAVAGIGNPDRFFDMLKAFGLDVIAHPLKDHAAITPADVVFNDERMVLMTEKDAVKCADMSLSNHWHVPVEVDIANADWLDTVAALVKGNPAQ